MIGKVNKVLNNKVKYVKLTEKRKKKKTTINYQQVSPMCLHTTTITHKHTRAKPKNGRVQNENEKENVGIRKRRKGKV